MHKPACFQLKSPASRPIVAALSLALLSACASAPIVDTKNVDQAKYQRDLSECQAYADQVSTAKSAGGGALLGAALGGAVGAVFGDSSTAVKSATAGGIVGGTQGAVKGEQSKDEVVRSCLRGRGYSVLN